MFGRPSGAEPLTEENCEFLYRPPTGPSTNGEESAHAHKVRRITRREVKVEKTAEDGTLADSEKGAKGTWTLSRRELEARGSTVHGTLRARFYVDKEAAEAAGRQG